MGNWKWCHFSSPPLLPSYCISHPHLSPTASLPSTHFFIQWPKYLKTSPSAENLQWYLTFKIKSNLFNPISNPFLPLSVLVFLALSGLGASQIYSSLLLEFTSLSCIFKLSGSLYAWLLFIIRILYSPISQAFFYKANLQPFLLVNMPSWIHFFHSTYQTYVHPVCFLVCLPHQTTLR